jgi:hypothetical protein
VKVFLLALLLLFFAGLCSIPHDRTLYIDYSYIRYFIHCTMKLISLLTYPECLLLTLVREYKVIYIQYICTLFESYRRAHNFPFVKIREDEIQV